jgi:hypothetical protein
LDDEALRVMDIAYDNAQRLLYDLGQPVVVQELIANAIIDIAARDERNPEKNGARSLEGFGLEQSG